jgi:hypothetical protein
MMNHRQIAANRITEYDPWRQRALDAIRADEEKAPGSEVVAETLLEIISSKTPRLRYPIGQQAKSVTRLRRFLPAGLFEQGVRRTFSLDRLNENEPRPDHVEDVMVVLTRIAIEGSSTAAGLSLIGTTTSVRPSMR